MLKNKINVGMRYGTPVESVATIAKSLGRHLANKEIDIKKRNEY